MLEKEIKINEKNKNFRRAGYYFFLKREIVLFI